MLANLILPVAAILFSVFFFISSLSLPGASSGMGPAGWPRIILSLMFLLGVILLIKELRILKSKKPADGEKGPVSAAEDSKPYSCRHWLAVGVIILLTLTVKLIGFPLAAMLFIAAMALVLGMRSWKIILCVTVIAGVALSLLFMNVLSLPLPEGAGVFEKLSGLLSLRWEG
jgi:hypothetical protein